MTTMRLSKHDLRAKDVLAGLAVRYGPYYQPIAKTATWATARVSKAKSGTPGYGRGQVVIIAVG
jgi:hypothetical protein